MTKFVKNAVLISLRYLSVHEISRSISIPSSKDTAQSDFLTACTRARVELGISDDPITTGSPPVRFASKVSRKKS